jgi:capsular polysaccharide biosynthesis protein
MSEQALNLRRSVNIVRRHKILVGSATALGLLLGSAYAVQNPPMLTSTALVVLPAAVQSAGAATGPGAGAATTPGGPDPYMATQIVIAGSNPVLSSALPQVSPAMSLQVLRTKIQVTSPATGILSISAKGRTAAQAEATANAVAGNYVAYVGSKASLAGTVSAHLLDSAGSASGTAAVKQLVVDALLGALLGALIGIIVAFVISRRDRRLRECDEIAGSIGIPVLASFPADHPRDPAGWTKLLEDYKPGDLDAWRLRNALRQLGMAGFNVNSDSDGGSSSLTVLSLSSDSRAMSIGPQLAVFAASLEISTTLVIGSQQDTDATATLRTACDVPPPASSKRSSYLRVVVSDGSPATRLPGAALTIVVAVVDARQPKVADTMHATTTVLGVSAGATTAEQLARAASSAAADGREIDGILVADPEPTDHTTGRNPEPPGPIPPKVPRRLRGLTTEIRR